MPLPKPRTDESESDFISRCMGNDAMVDEYPDDEQREAVYHSLFNDGKAIKQTGTTDGHKHSFDDTESGRTSTVEGHSHPYDPNDDGTGEEEGHTHSLPSTSSLVTGDEEFKDFDFSFKVTDDGEPGEFEGHGSVFGVTDFMSEVVKRGAFRNTLKEHKAKGRLPALLWQHFSDEPIGFYKEMKEDKRGLSVRGQLLIDDIPKARQAHALMKNNGLSGLSIGYRVRVDEVDRNSGIRTLKEIDLFEVSVVTFPALDVARISDVKKVLAKGGYPSKTQMEQFLVRKAGFTRSQARSIMREGYDEFLAKRKAGDNPDKSISELADRVKRFRQNINS